MTRETHNLAAATVQTVDNCWLLKQLGTEGSLAFGFQAPWYCGIRVTEVPVLPVSPADSQLKVWMSKYGWSADESGQIFICSQEESIKPKNIVEKIDFDSEWWPNALGCGAKGCCSTETRAGAPQDHGRYVLVQG